MNKIFEKPPILDSVINYYSKDSGENQEIDGMWFIAMPLNYKWKYLTIKKKLNRIYHGLLVMLGYARAVQFAQQRKELCGKIT